MCLTVAVAYMTRRKRWSWLDEEFHPPPGIVNCWRVRASVDRRLEPSNLIGLGPTLRRIRSCRLARRMAGVHASPPGPCESEQFR